MICPYCKKELQPFRIHKLNKKSIFIGWLCKCTDEIRDKVMEEVKPDEGKMA